jgi:hypothetical protein
MDNPNASSGQKPQKAESGKENKPLAKGESQKQKSGSYDDEKSVDSQSEFSRLDKLRNEEE